MKTLSVIFLLLSSVCFSANSHFSFDGSFSRLDLSSADIRKIIRFSGESRNSEELVTKLSEEYREVDFIVVPERVKATLFWKKSISRLYFQDVNRFRDSRIGERKIEHFRMDISYNYCEGKRSRAYGRFYAGTGHVHTTAPYCNGYDESRESKMVLNRSAIVLAGNAPKSTVVHEFLHFLIYKKVSESMPVDKKKYRIDDIAATNFSADWNIHVRKFSYSTVENNTLWLLSHTLRGEGAEHLDISLFIWKNREALALNKTDRRTVHYFLHHYARIYNWYLPYLKPIYRGDKKILGLPLRYKHAVPLILKEIRQVAAKLEDIFEETPLYVETESRGRLTVEILPFVTADSSQ